MSDETGQDTRLDGLIVGFMLGALFVAAAVYARTGKKVNEL